MAGRGFFDDCRKWEERFRRVLRVWPRGWAAIMGFFLVFDVCVAYPHLNTLFRPTSFLRKQFWMEFAFSGVASWIAYQDIRNKEEERRQRKESRRDEE